MRANATIRWSASVILLLTLAACATARRPSRVELPASGPDADLVARVPVVDIHTHTFNARFLPVVKLALGKRDVHWAAIFARPLLLAALAEKITALTKLDRRPPDTSSEDLAMKANEIAAETEGASATISAAEVENEPGITGIEKIAEGQPAQALSDAELPPLAGIVSLVAKEEQGPVDKTERKSEIRHFLKCLLASDKELVDKFHTDHQGKVKLMVSHMMDLAPVFNQEEDGTKLLPVREQISRFRAQQEAANGRMLYFVAYNPFRDHYRGGRPGNALAIVKYAYEKQGAFGVKVYPPAGYAPFWNYIPQPPPKVPRTPWRQWQARYQPKGVLLAKEELDRRLLELFRWAVAEDVPLFVHTGTSEVEARKGYHDMADPIRWKALLDAHEDLRNIRICFAHAGASDYWFGGKGTRKWGQTIFELCAKYPNIYCEFGVHDAIVSEERRADFSTKLATLIPSSWTPDRFDFSTKILYGSDWYMPMIAGRDRVNYLNAHRDAILDLKVPGIEREQLYKNYFFRNALAFLNVRKRLDRGGLPPRLRAELRGLLGSVGKEDFASRQLGAGTRLLVQAEAQDGETTRP